MNGQATNIGSRMYHGCNFSLTEQFIHGLDDGCMISEILREVLTLEDIDAFTSDRGLLWAQGVKVQMAQKETLNNIQEAKDFDAVRHSIPKHDKEAHKNRKEWKLTNNSGTENLPRQCPTYSKRCTE